MNTDNITKVTDPTFSVALNGTVAAGDSVELLLGGSSLVHPVTHTITGADITAGSVSLPVTAGDLGADGVKQISAHFADSAGNSSTTPALAVTLDTTPPQAEVSSLTQTGAGSNTGVIFTGVSENSSTILTIAYKNLDQGTTSNFSPNVSADSSNGTWSYTTPLTGFAVANKVYEVDVTSRDVAGNQATASSFFSANNSADSIAATSGHDFFVYQAAGGSSPSKFDTIIGFNVTSDKIDLSAIDANTGLSGDQAFTFQGNVSTANTVNAHSISYFQDTAHNETIMYGDVTPSTNNNVALEIHLAGILP